MNSWYRVIIRQDDFIKLAPVIFKAMAEDKQTNSHTVIDTWVSGKCGKWKYVTLRTTSVGIRNYILHSAANGHINIDEHAKED